MTQAKVLNLPIFKHNSPFPIAHWRIRVGMTETEAFDTAPVVIKEIFWNYQVNVPIVIEWLYNGWTLEQILHVVKLENSKQHWKRMAESADDYKKRISTGTWSVSASCDSINKSHESKGS